MTCKKIENILVKSMEIKMIPKTVCIIDRDTCDGEDKKCPHREDEQQEGNIESQHSGDVEVKPSNQQLKPKTLADCDECPLQYICIGEIIKNTRRCRGARSQLRD